MYLAMNRFKVASGREQEFIEIWQNRDTFLAEVPGFKSFELLQGPNNEGYTLFASHSVWESEQAFKDWTQSEAFRKAHANAGGTKRDIYLGPPQLECFKQVV
ncbi:antibiotic biosynthesis monooxygenase family protein [Halioxenophilus aromaticivorans]|uniref:Antibiotic biosynthesis monooxygenase n=1 Tax=Halioxenophilus aromaticivorans TaxID=1306992 RepID=A0AAV3U1D3_9ALTE